MDLVSDETVLPWLKIRLIYVVPSIHHLFILGWGPVLLTTATTGLLSVWVLEHLSNIHLLLWDQKDQRVPLWLFWCTRGCFHCGKRQLNPNWPGVLWWVATKAEVDVHSRQRLCCSPWCQSDTHTHTNNQTCCKVMMNILYGCDQEATPPCSCEHSGTWSVRSRRETGRPRWWWSAPQEWTWRSVSQSLLPHHIWVSTDSISQPSAGCVSLLFVQQWC